MSDDIFNGTNDDDTFDGGTGTDMVTFAGSAAGYRIDTLSDGRVQVVDIDNGNGDTGTDTLSSIETLSFSDKSYSLAVESTLIPEGVVEVDSYTPSGASEGQRDPAITMLADGGYVIIWVSDDQDGSDTGVYAQRYDAAGNRVGPETRINTSTVQWQDAPAATALPDGGFLITWASNNFGTSAIYSQRFDVDGDPVGSETRINGAGDDQVDAPSVTTLADGGYVVTWKEWDVDGSYDGIAARRFDANGNPVGTETVVNTYTNFLQTAPAVAALAGGGYVITWQSEQDGDLPYYGDGSIHFQRYDVNGNAVGGEVHVNTQTEDEQAFPTIAALADGGFVIAWQSGAWEDGGIYFRRYGADGNPTGVEIHVSDTTYSSQTPTLTRLADGGFALAWTTNNDVYTQRFDADGDVVGSQTQVTDTGFDAEISPTITALADGGYVVAWASYYGDGIYAQRFDALGNPWGPATLRIAGTGGNDVINGGAGVQRIEGLAGNDTLNGGDGKDVAIFSGDSDGYRIEYLGSGRTRIVDIDLSNGDTGTDILTGIEALKFSDKSYQVGVSDLFVNAPEGEGQRDAHIVVLGDGSYVVAWEGGEVWDPRSYVQRYDANGNPLGGIKTLGAGGEAAQPVIAVLDDGGYVVVYSTRNDGGPDLYFERFDAAGNAIGGRVEVAHTNFNWDNSVNTAITVLADGGFVVTWEEDVGSATDDIYAQRFAANGSKVGADVRVNTTTDHLQTQSAIAALADGGYLVVWQSHTDDGVYGREDVYAKRFNAAGNVVMGETRINVGSDRGFGPDIAALDDGGYVITWEFLAAGGVREIHARRYDAAGQAVGSEVKVNTTTADVSEASVTVLKGGGYVIAWHAYDSAAEVHDIHAQRFDSSGNKVGGETQVNLEEDVDNLYPEITALADGGYLISWSSDHYNGLGYQLGAQRFDANGNLQPPSGSKITGTSGDDVIIAGSQQVLVGLDGDDTYILSGRNRIIEKNGDGIDTVHSSASCKLGKNVEKLLLLGTGNINGTGNGQDNVLTGNSGNNVLVGGEGEDTLIGGGGDDSLVDDDQTNMNQLIGGSGNDVYYVAGDGSVEITEQAGGGTDTVRSWLSCTLANNVEDLVLTGTLDLSGTGNSLGNIITGNAGNNFLSGGGGADELRGGLGNDTYALFDNDLIVENAGQGTDTVQASFSYGLGANLENLTLTGSNAIDGTGNGGNNIITGNSAKNILNGGAGVDQLRGGLGDDVYMLDDADAIIENAGEGTDSVYASISYTLAANLERLTLTGSSAINGTGNGGNNIITGNAGNNVLNGGAGADTLLGGLGNDSYIITDNDVISEIADQGSDAVWASISYALSANLESLTLGGTAAINGTGNTLNNILTGNSGNNILNGGAGADQLRGGLGNDTYALSDNDTITESAGQGTDTVWAAFSYTLGANLEYLTLTGTASINGVGNTLNNILTGNTGNNILNGGTGLDQLRGGLGNDTYALSDNDAITENAGQGTDTVWAAFSYTLGANLENLTFTGTASLNGAGNTLNNVITGNSGNNILGGNSGFDTLNGGLGNDTLVGGANNDTLTGGTGLDAFRFDRFSTGFDTILDYRAVDDRIEFADAQLKKVAGAGPLNSTFFRASTTGNAVDRNDFLLYETDTGKLFYDMDGSGAGAKVLFAILGTSAHPAMTSAEFIVV